MSRHNNRTKRRAARRRLPLMIKIGFLELSLESLLAALIVFCVARNLATMRNHQKHYEDIRQQNGQHQHEEPPLLPTSVASWLEASQSFRQLTTTNNKKNNSTTARGKRDRRREQFQTASEIAEHVRELSRRHRNKTSAALATAAGGGSVTRDKHQIGSGSPHGVHIVISHCHESIAWFFEETRKEFFAEQQQQHNKNNHHNVVYEVSTITILSKCGAGASAVVDEDELQLPCDDRKQRHPLVSVLNLPNLGRNDHSFAYWISSVLDQTQNQNSGAGGDKDDSDINNNVTHEVAFVNDAHVRFCRATRRSSSASSSSLEQRLLEEQQDPLRRIASVIHKDDLVVFLKDNNNIYRSAIEANMPLRQILEQTLFNNGTTYRLGVNAHIKAPSFPRGVACGSIPHLDDKLFEWTSWAHRSILWTFYLNEYRRTRREQNANFRAAPLQRPMGNWILHLASLGEVFDGEGGSSSSTYHPMFSDAYMEHAVEAFDPDFVPPTFNQTKTYTAKDIVPVCFGGVFATQWGQIASEDAAITLRGWKAISAALTREDNLEEGHYMERWWMDILSWSSYNRKRWTPSRQTNTRRRHLEALAAANASNAEWVARSISMGKNNNGDSELRTATVSSPKDQMKLLRSKARHFARPSPYVGVILLFSQQLRQRQDILEGWEASRKRRERKRNNNNKGPNSPDDLEAVALGNGAQRTYSDLGRLRQAQKAVQTRKKYWERD